MRRSDRTLSFSVWSEDVSTSGRVKKTTARLTRLWLRPVGVHRTRPVMIPEELDLSGIDRTLGGSVRSLPPEHPVSGSRAFSGLFSVSFSVTSGDLFNSVIPSFLIPRDLALVLAAASTARQPRAAVLLPRRTTAAHPRQHSPLLPCPRSPGPRASRAPP